jgi:cobalamin biosynthesis Mg chelatase CobN
MPMVAAMQSEAAKAQAEVATAKAAAIISTAGENSVASTPPTMKPPVGSPPAQQQQQQQQQVHAVAAAQQGSTQQQQQQQQQQGQQQAQSQQQQPQPQQNGIQASGQSVFTMVSSCMLQRLAEANPHAGSPSWFVPILEVLVDSGLSCILLLKFCNLFDPCARTVQFEELTSARLST